jgi:thioredoxin-related protein
MKNRITLLCFALFTSLTIFAQDGMVFTEGNWESILKQAKEQDKVIFFDAYTTWCGPCKMLAKNVFPTAEVGDYYNANFINVSFDMEKGEGIELAKRYDVEVYPTLLFIDGDGNIVHRTAGYMQPEQFLQLGKDANNPERNLAGMKARYEAGERHPEFLHAYTIAAAGAMDGSHQAIFETYLESQDDWSKKRNVKYIFEFVESPDSKAFDFMVANKEPFVDMFGKEMVGNKINRIIQSKLYQQGDALSLEEIDALYQKAFPEKADQFSAQFKMNYYRRAKDLPKFAQTAVEYFSKYSSDSANELNNIAWTFFEEVDDKAMLAEAAKWAQRSVELDPQYYNYDTLTAVHYKLGNTDKAIAAAKKAIEIAKANGEGYDATQKMLDELLKMKG